MKNLDLINPAFAKPRNLCSVGAILPVIFSLCSTALISGIPTENHFSKKIILYFFIISATISFSLLFIPRLFNWGWTARYFFVSTIQMGSIALLSIVPWLCFLLYSHVSWGLKLICTLAFAWCTISLSRKFFSMYGEIKRSPTLLENLYWTEQGKAFYIQKNDIFLIEDKFKLSLYPPTRYFIIFFVIAVASIPFSSNVVDHIGIPYPHIFLGIFSIPIGTMALAFLTRGWFVYMYLPKKLGYKSREVYVDMASKRRLAHDLGISSED